LSWKQFLLEPSAEHLVAFPRHIGTQNSIDIQLLGFSDVSLKGYAISAYLQIKMEV